MPTLDLGQSQTKVAAVSLDAKRCFRHDGASASNHPSTRHPANSLGVLLAAFLFLLTSPVQATDQFVFGAGESVLFHSTFTNASGWTLRDMVVTNGELRGVAGNYWMGALHRFPRTLTLDEGDIAIYWSLRADRTLGEERGKVFVHFNMTDDPAVLEQFSLTMNVRPGGWFYPLYADPGFNIPHTIEETLDPPPGGFPNAQTFETYRLLLRKTGTNFVQITPCWWNRTTNGWQAIPARPGSHSPLVAQISTHLLGHEFFYSLEVQFYESVPAVDALAVTQLPAQSGLRGVVEGGTFCIQFQGRAERNYYLERSEDLQAWTAVSAEVSGTGNLQSLLDSTRPAGRGFYRVRSWFR